MSAGGRGGSRMQKDDASSSSSCVFITNKMCPFAQKAWIALERSGISYEMKQITLYGPGGKPDWFWDLNPQGTVPVLVVDNNNNKNKLVLPDSDLILDYCLAKEEDEAKAKTKTANNSDEETKEAQQQQQQQQQDRLMWNEWQELLQTKLLPIGKRAVLSGNSSAKRELEELLKNQVEPKFKQQQKRCDGGKNKGGVDGGGLYLGGGDGSKSSIVDCAVFPFLWRLEQEFQFTSDDDGMGGLDGMKAWLETCEQDPAFQKTIQSSWWWWW